MGVKNSRVSILDQIEKADGPEDEKKDELRISGPIKSERVIHVVF